MNNPKFTFLLPAYKAKFFEEALTSIKQQTYKDFKVIVSDDCSPEDLKCIFDRSVGEDPRFMFRRNTENIGGKSLVAHWNLLVDMCDTEYLIMASDDDVYEPAFLEEIDELTCSYPYVDLLRGRTKIIGEGEKTIIKDPEFSVFMDYEEFIINQYSIQEIKCVANFVFRTNKMKQLKGFINTPLAWFSDELSTLKMSKSGCCNTKSIVFSFRCAGQNISSQKDTPETASKKAKAVLVAYKNLGYFIDDYEKNNKESRLYYNVIKVCKNRRNEWGERIYWWLMDADFKTFIKLMPQSIIYGIWNWRWIEAITKHQIKKIYNIFNSIICCYFYSFKRRYKWFIKDPIARRPFQKLKILDSFDSIKYICDHKCSVSRYGDGELTLFYGKEIGFQKVDIKLVEQLKHVLQANDAPNHIIGIPYFLKNVKGTVKGTRELWGNLVTKYGKQWIKLFPTDRLYLDTQLSRFFVEYKDYERSTRQLKLLKKIWENRDVVIIEGNKCRTGIGNDLYNNVRSLQRILGYATNAFSHYDEMLNAIKENVKPKEGKLLLLSYGPTATILAYDLAKLGYQAVDIGHLDIEYEWYLKKDYNCGVVEGKYTNEAKGGNIVKDCFNETYLSQIICDITKE